MEKEILTVKEAAEFLRLKKPTIYKYVQERSIPFVKSGKGKYSKTLFKVKDLREWLDNRTVKPIGG